MDVNGYGNILVENVSFGFFPGKNVISNLSVRVGSGEFVGIIGANGSGKTTLARLLNGSLLPDSGEVMVAGISTKMGLPALKQYVNVIYADAENQLITPTVYEELLFSLSMLEISEDEIARRINSALELFDLKKYKNFHPYKLSTGEQFRLLIAIAWTRKPRILILDEVLSMLDSVNRNLIRHLLKKWREEQPITTVMITHRLEDLCESDRIIVIGNGKVIADGEVANIFRQSLGEIDWQVEVPLIYQLYLQMNEKDGYLYNQLRAFIPDNLRR